MTPRPLRAGIVGAGLIARQKHVPAFARLRNELELVAVCDVDRAQAAALAKVFGIRAVYQDVAEMVERERLDLVDLCTPPRTHAKLAVAALRAGSHLLIEKPLATSVADCDRIGAAAAAAGREVCVAHTSLFYPAVMRARAAVARGDVGRVRGIRIWLSTPTSYMTARPNHWAHALPGGVVGESGPHPVYLSLALMGRVAHVHVEAVKLLPEYPWSPFEDYRIELVGESAVASIALTYASNQWAAQMDIMGETGTITIDLEARTTVINRRTTLTARGVGRSVAGAVRQLSTDVLRNAAQVATNRIASTHQVLLQRFAASIREGTQAPCPLAEGREAVRVLDLITTRIDALTAEAVRA